MGLMGWGRTGYYDNYCDQWDDDYYNDKDYCYPDYLLEGTNVFVSREECNDIFDEVWEDDDTEPPEEGWISTRMMCSIDNDGNGNDVFTGNGDSGGPIIDKETKVQVGVTSWGVDEEGTPSVYAKVATEIDWINSWIKDWNFEPKTCKDVNNRTPCNEKVGCSWKNNKVCRDALTNEQCKNWNGKKQACKRKGCIWKKKGKKCKSRWP